MEKLALVILVFVSFFSFSQKDSLIKIDSAILIDKGNLSPNWKAEVLANAKIHNRSRVGIEFNLSYKISRKFNIIYLSDFQYFYDYNGYKYKETPLYNFTIGTDFLLFKKEKLRKAKYTRKFYDDSLDVLFKPKFNVLNTRKTFLSFGINRYTFIENFTPSDRLVVENPNASDFTFDKKFDVQPDGFDLDGFLNEMKLVERINYYNLVIGLKHTKHYNYSFSIKNQKIAQKSENEVYSNFIFGLYNNFKTNNSYLKEEIVKNSFFSRLGFNFGIKNTIRLRKNNNAIIIKSEVTMVPTLILVKKRYFSYDLKIENNSYTDMSNGSYSYIVSSPYINEEFDIYNSNYNRKVAYIQISIGYSFGQKY